MKVISHRGLEPSQKNFYPESSFEAFRDHLDRGYSIEFDPNFTIDTIVVSHDSNLKRVTNGENNVEFKNINFGEIEDIRYGIKKKGRIPKLTEILELISKYSGRTHAMHLKGKFQTSPYIDLLIENLSQFRSILDQIVIFDVKPETAKLLKKEIPTIHLSPSVSHGYDIERYNEVTGGTLLSLEEALDFRNLYDWVWLDEWDLKDRDNCFKNLYNKDVFNQLKSHNYKIGLVTPELHGTSPGLLGGESHPDAADKNVLFNRIKEIISLSPDAICTDYPEEVKAMYLAR